MSRLNVITTKFGDSGKTNLVTRNVSKSSKIIECIGSIDEANSCIGMAVNELQVYLADYLDLFSTIQNNLFDLGADIILNTTKIGDKHISFLENEIEKINSKLPPLESFVLPKGTVSVLHYARSVVRRAERAFWRSVGKNNTEAGIYLNRLSDLLFVICREINYRLELKEEKWQRI